MKTMEQKINDFLAQHPEHEQRIHRELQLLRDLPVAWLFEHREQSGELFFPAYMDLSCFLVLYVLGLSPVNPLDFDLAVEGEFEEDKYPKCDFMFYTDVDIDLYGMDEYLENLDILEHYWRACYVLKTSLYDITDRMVTQTDMRPFLQSLLADRRLIGKTPWLDKETMKIMAKQDMSAPLSFKTMVDWVAKCFVEAHPRPYLEKYQIAGIYMDVLILAWKWWFRELGIMVLYPKNSN